MRSRGRCIGRTPTSSSESTLHRRSTARYRSAVGKYCGCDGTFAHAVARLQRPRRASFIRSPACLEPMPRVVPGTSRDSPAHAGMKRRQFETCHGNRNGRSGNGCDGNRHIRRFRQQRNGRWWRQVTPATRRSSAYAKSRRSPMACPLRRRHAPKAADGDDITETNHGRNRKA